MCTVLLYKVDVDKLSIARLHLTGREIKRGTRTRVISSIHVCRFDSGFALGVEWTLPRVLQQSNCQTPQPHDELAITMRYSA